MTFACETAADTGSMRLDWADERYAVLDRLVLTG